MKSLKIYLLVAGILLVLYVVVQYNRPKDTNWAPTFINTEKNPFGTYIVYNRLEDLFPRSAIVSRRVPVYNVLVDGHYNKTAYIIICNSIEPSDADYDQLMDYITTGNDVFIAAGSLGHLFDKRLKTEVISNMGEYNKVEYINFVNPRLSPDRQYFVDRQSTDNYFGALDTAKAILLGNNSNGIANFIQYKIGKGSLYLAANPKMFSNYSLLKSQGADYAAAALSYLKDPKQVIWDEYYTQGSAGEGSPMRVLLNNPILQWAYYIALFSLVVYVLYGIKRRQRIIPVIEPLKNSTIDFVNVVGQVYYEQRDNVDISHKKIQYFFTSLRDDFQLSTNHPDNEFTVSLAQKAGLELSFARELVDYIIYISNQQRVTDKELLELNKLIEKFYTLSALSNERRRDI